MLNYHLSINDQNIKITAILKITVVFRQLQLCRHQVSGLQGKDSPTSFKLAGFGTYSLSELRLICLAEQGCS